MAMNKIFTALVVVAMSSTLVVILFSFTNRATVRTSPSVRSAQWPSQAFSSRRTAAVDHSKCPLDAQFRVFLYNHHSHQHLQQYSQAHHPLLKSLESSLKQKNMWASTPHEACAFLIVLRPFLQLSSPIHNSNRVNQNSVPNLLQSLPYWKFHGSKGKNHIIIDLLEPKPEGSPLFDLNQDIDGAIMVANYLTDSAGGILAPPLPREISKQSTSNQATRESSVYASVEKVYAAAAASHTYSSIVPLKRKHLFYFEGNYMGSAHHNSHEVGELLSTIQKQAFTLSDHNYFMLSSNCGPSDNPAWNGEWRMCGHNETDRLIQCKNSNFSLILGPLSSNESPGPSTYQRLIESLKCGSIPVVIGLDTLPFDDVIDWRRAALVFPWDLWQDALRAAAAMNADVIMEFRKQGKFLLHTYFSSPSLVLDSIVAVVRKKFLHPPPVALGFTPTILKRADNRQHQTHTKVKDSSQYVNYALNMGDGIWNTPPGPHFVYPETPFQPLSYHNQIEARRMPLPNSIQALRKTTYEFQIHKFLKTDRLSVLKQFANVTVKDSSPVQSGSKSTTVKKRSQGPSGSIASKYKYSDITEMYTVVTLTHHRDEQIAKRVAILEKCPFLHKIVIVWNNEYPISEQVDLPDTSIPIEIVSTGKNSLNNRFLPLSNIETEAVLTLDDDISLTCDDIELGFRIWRENRDTIVGWTSRVHGIDPGGSWSYSFARVCERSMVITNAAFFHKYYSYLYSYWMPAEIREIVDLFMNCEDIAMNFLVSHIIGKSQVKVGKKRAIQAQNNCKDDPQSGLSCESSSHFLERDFCLNAFADYYGYVPLVYSIARTEPLYVKSPSRTQWCDKYNDDS